MAITYPGARWTPLGAQTESRMRAHDVICLHTMVGYLTSTDPYFRVYNGAGYAGTESHFGVGGKWGPDLGGGLDGAVWQWQDLAYQASANLSGNYRVLSIETADNAPRYPQDIEAWTPAQLDAIVALVSWLCSLEAHAQCPTDWLCHQEGIPRALIPDSKPGRRGIGYHAQGAAEIVVGGEEWSTDPDKPCPAARRIAQIKTIVVPRVAGTTPEEDDVQIADLNDAAAKGQLNPFLDALAARTMTFVRDKAGLSTAAQVSTAVQQIASRVTDVKSGVLAAIQALPTDGLDEAARDQLVADIVAGVDALDQDDAAAVAAALAERPLVFGPAA